MNVIKVINPDNGYDNVICIADSIDAAAFYLDCNSVAEFNKRANDNNWDVSEECLQTLPNGCNNIAEAVEKHGAV